MNIWLITVGETLPMIDPSSRPMRTALFARELASRGHSVTWWQSTVSHTDKAVLGDKTFEMDWAGVLCVFLHAAPYTRNLSVARFRHHIETARAFREVAETRNRPDVIVVALPTPELAAAAISFGRAHGVPVYVDIRDLWPDEIALRAPKITRPFVSILTAPMARQCRAALQGAKGIFAVSPSYLDWGLRHAGRPANGHDRIFFSGYPENQGKVGSVPAIVDVSKKIVLLVSTLNNSIDFRTFLDAARLLKDREDIQFVVCGTGEGESIYSGTATDLNSVVMLGWVNRAAISALLQVAKIGLVPYHSRTAVSLPNKMFEYFSGGVPVLTSLNGDAKKIVETNDCGTYYRPERPDLLRDAILSSLEDDAKLARQSTNAQSFFQRNCRSSSVYAAMADHITS